MTSLLAVVCLPGVTYLAVNSEIVVRLVLGEKWLPSAPILRVMAIAGLAWPLVGTCGTVMMTCGRTTRYFWWGVASAVTLSVSFLIGARWGSYGVAVAYCVWTYVTLIPSLWISLLGSPLRVADSAAAARNATLASMAMAVGLGLLPTIHHAPIVQFIWTFTLGICFYLGALCMQSGGRAELRRYAGYARALSTKAT